VSSMIVVEFCPATMDVKVPPPAEGVYFHRPGLGIGSSAASDLIHLKYVGVI